jgi:wyosine [tRNA(Phe)-imidazoG37] synthetase (radical SAM superfamily)
MSCQSIGRVFGPVQSRRLGKSLGIDPVPLKTCNWNCVYCQLGRSRPLVGERAEYVPTPEILDEARQALARIGRPDIEWVTFVGSGETTLHINLGTLIRNVREFTEAPIAVITNGSFLFSPQVRQDLRVADAVLPALDAGSPERYRQINRPHPYFTFDRHINGLIEFRQEFAGSLWLEVMMLQGVNDDERALLDLRHVIDRIQPDRVHLAVPFRPPAESWVRPAGEEGLMRARAILGDVATVMHPAEGQRMSAGEGGLREAIMGVITRHPMRLEELKRMLEDQEGGQVECALQLLAEEGRAEVVERLGACFWVSSGAFFPD